MRGRWSAISLFCFPRKQRSGETCHVICGERETDIAAAQARRHPGDGGLAGRFRRCRAIWRGCRILMARPMRRISSPRAGAMAMAIMPSASRARAAICSWAASGFIWKMQGYEFGYWLGKPFWGMGYATEAARGLGCDSRSSAWTRPFFGPGWFHDNPASGHVLAKLGARHNGSRMRRLRWPAAWKCCAMRCC